MSSLGCNNATQKLSTVLSVGKTYKPSPSEEKFKASNRKDALTKARLRAEVALDLADARLQDFRRAFDAAWIKVSDASVHMPRLWSMHLEHP